jgi:hypothetical protein
MYLVGFPHNPAALFPLERHLMLQSEVQTASHLQTPNGEIYQLGTDDHVNKTTFLRWTNFDTGDTLNPVVVPKGQPSKRTTIKSDGLLAYLCEHSPGELHRGLDQRSVWALWEDVRHLGCGLHAVHIAVVEGLHSGSHELDHEGKNFVAIGKQSIWSAATDS